MGCTPISIVEQCSPSGTILITVINHVNITPILDVCQAARWDGYCLEKAGAALQRLFQVVDHLADRVESRLPKVFRGHVDADFGENRLRRFRPAGTQQI